MNPPPTSTFCTFFNHSKSMELNNWFVSRMVLIFVMYILFFEITWFGYHLQIVPAIQFSLLNGLHLLVRGHYWLQTSMEGLLFGLSRLRLDCPLNPWHLVFFLPLFTYFLPQLLRLASVLLLISFVTLSVGLWSTLRDPNKILFRDQLT